MHFNYLMRIFLLLLLLSAVQPQSYFRGTVGNFTPSITARSLAMGHTGVAADNGISNLWTNPALLRQETLFSAEIAYLSTKVEEKRSFPVIDMFDDRVTDNIYNINRNRYSNTAFVILMKPTTLPLSLAFGKSPFMDFRYDYEEEVRASLSSSHYNRDPLVGYHRISRDGRLWMQSGGASLNLGMLSTGITISYLQEEAISNERSVIVIEQDNALASDTTLILSGDPKLENPTPMVTVGVALDLTNRFRIGASFRSQVEFDLLSSLEIPIADEETLLPSFAWQDSIVDLSFSVPEVISVGINYRPKNPIPAQISAEVRYTDWSEFSITYSDSINESIKFPVNLRECFDFRVGLEHLVLSKIPFRFGFVYSQSPYGEEFDRTLFTAGTGFPIGDKLTIDVSVEFSMGQYSYPDLFPAVGSVAGDLETVRESHSGFALNMRYAP